MSQPGAPLIGTVLAEKYRLDTLLGTGGFGAVYRGWHLLLDVPVAVKIAFRVDGGLGRRFRREARTLMRLRHPNIVRMYDYGRDPQGHVFMVQEFIEGQPLDALRKLHGRLPPASVIEIALQTLGALAAAHAEGIVHRDIKPANLMVIGGLASPKVQLLDFGIAKMHGVGDAEQSELTRPGGSPGTPAYMSPEQIHGQAEPASDLYALGATLFRLCTGDKPFPSSVPRVYLAHLQDPVPDLPSYVPPALAAVIHRAMAKSTADRFQSAGEMAGALRAYVSSGLDLGVASASTVSMQSMLDLDDTASSARPSVPGPQDEWALRDTQLDSTSAEGRGAIDIDSSRLDGPPPGRWVGVLGLILAVGLALGLGSWGLWTDDGASTAADTQMSALGHDSGPVDAGRSRADAQHRPIDALIFSPLDSDPPEADAVPEPPKRQKPPKKVIRPRSTRSLVNRLKRDIEKDLQACRCSEVKPGLAKLQALDRSAAKSLRQSYSTKCVVVGLPGGCQ